MAGMLHITVCRLVEKCHLTFTIQRVCWRLIFFRSTGIPCLLYIDDRNNGELQIPLEQGEYGTLSTADERMFAAAKSAIFLVSFYLVVMDNILGLSKSSLTPSPPLPPPLPSL